MAYDLLGKLGIISKIFRSTGKMKTNKGFSLIELLIVIAIIGIMAGIAAPLFNKYRHNTNLKEAARDFSSDIALYRQRAVAENIHYKITFDQPANNYTVQKETASGSGVYIDLVPAVTKGTGVYGQVIIADDPTPTIASITFSPRGTMSAGTITLKHTIRLSTAAIITNITGRVYVTYDLK